MVILRSGQEQIAFWCIGDFVWAGEDSNGILMVMDREEAAASIEQFESQGWTIVTKPI